MNRVVALVLVVGSLACTRAEDEVGDEKRALMGTRAEAAREVEVARDEAARRLVATRRELDEDVAEVEREAADDIDEAAEDVQEAIRGEELDNSEARRIARESAAPR